MNPNTSVFAQNATASWGGGNTDHTITGSHIVSCSSSETYIRHATDTVTNDTTCVTEVVSIPQPDPHG